MKISFPAETCDDIKAPSLIVENTKRCLIISDLHFGIESELNSKGIYIQSHASERRARIFELISRTNPDHLIILGDVKHRIPGTSKQEYRELPYLLEDIRKLVPMTICFGNHDPGLEQFLSPEEIAPATGISIDETSYMHGHTRPAREFAGTLIICGHHHPTIGLHDGIGIGFRTPCFVLAKLDDDIWHGKENNDENDTIDEKHEKEATGTKQKKNKKQETDDISKNITKKRETRVLLMPAFNECVGYDLRKTVFRPFSAISRAIEKNSAEVMLIDGTYAGDMASLIGYLEE